MAGVNNQGAPKNESQALAGKSSGGGATEAGGPEGPPGAGEPILESSGPALSTRYGNLLGSYFVALYLRVSASPDSRLLITVAASGALGSLVHCLTSFADYVGNRRLRQSWVWFF